MHMDTGLFGGLAAMPNKAQEVRQLIEAAKECGIEPDKEFFFTIFSRVYQDVAGNLNGVMEKLTKLMETAAETGED